MTAEEPSRRPAAASSPSSARPTPASRRWSTRWSAPRSRSSATRCRRRACPCAASPSRARASSCSSTRPASSRRAAGSTAPWWTRPGAAPATPTSSSCWSMPPRAWTRRSSASSTSCKASKHAAAAGAQQDRSRARRSGCWSWRRTSMSASPFAATFMISALNGDGVADLKSHLAARGAAGSLALSRGRGLRRAAAAAGGRDHAREDLRAPARGAALPADRRDDRLEGAEGRRAHRADHLRRARQPEEHRARQGRAA